MSTPISDEEYEEVHARAKPIFTTGEKAGWGTKLGAAFDTMQGDVLGIPEAFGLDTFKERRLQNQLEGRTNRQRADEQLGIPESFDKARGFGGIAKLTAGTLVDSTPAMGAVLAGGAVGGIPGALGVAYAQHLGEKLSEQREQAGQTDLLTASLTAAPSAMIDVATGAQGRLMRTIGGKAGKQIFEELPGAVTRAADRVGGVTGAAARWGLRTGKTAAEEMVGETTQEVLSQGARMGVDRTANLLDPEAIARYRESAILGGLSGGAIGSINLGRRSAPAEPATPGEDKIGDRADPGASAESTTRREQRQSEARWAFDPQHRAGTFYGPERPAGGLQPPGAPPVPPGAPPGAPGAPSQPSVPPGSTVAPQAAKEVDNTFGIPVASAIAQQQPATPEQNKWQELKNKTAALREMEAQAVKDGVDPKHLSTYMKLGKALDDGLIDEATHQASVAALASGNKSLIAEVTKALNAADKPAKPAAAPAAPPVPTGPPPAPTTAAFPTPPAAPPATTAVAPPPAAVAKPAAAAAPLAADVTPGMRAASAFKRNNKKATPLSEHEQARKRAFLLLGLDDEGNAVGPPLTIGDVAHIESVVQGKGAAPVKDQAISNQMIEFGLDKEARAALYEQIHGVPMPVEEDVTVDDTVDEGEDVELEPEHKVGPAESDEFAFAEATPDSGIRLTTSANKNVTVEETTAKQRIKILDDLASGKGYNDAQKAAFKAAKGKGKDQGGIAGVKALLADKKNFSPEELASLKVLFEHGKTSKAAAGRRARVEQVISQRLGVLTQHEQQVRERIAAENAVRMAREEQAALERQAAMEDDMAGADEAVDEDGRTLRMRLMDPNKIKQERLIGESLVDAKAKWAEFVEELSDEEYQFPAWNELPVDEQVAFVKAMDTFNYPPPELADMSVHEAGKQLKSTAFDLGEAAVKHKAVAAKKAERAAVVASPEFQQLVREEREGRDKAEAAERERIKAEAAERKAERDKEAAERKAAKAAAPAPAPAAPAVEAAPPAPPAAPAAPKVTVKKAKRVAKPAPAPAPVVAAEPAPAPAAAPEPESDLTDGRMMGPAGYAFPSVDMVVDVKHEFMPGEVNAIAIGETDGHLNFGKFYADGRYHIQSNGKNIAFAEGSWGEVGPGGIHHRGDYDPANLQAETIRVLTEVGAKPKEQANAQAQGTSGSVDQPAGQEVQRSGTGEAGGQVPEGGAGGAAAPASEPGAGTQGVRAEDAGTAQEQAPEGGGSDVADAPMWAGLLRDSAQEAPIEGGIQLDGGGWVAKDHAVEAAYQAMSDREHGMPFQFHNVLGIRPAHWDEMVAAMKAMAESPKLKSLRVVQEAREESPAPLTVTEPAGAQRDVRTPSVTRTVRTAARRLEDGTMTPDTFAAVTTAALDAADAARRAKQTPGLLRGADRIMEMLLAGRRRGELSHEGVEMAMWFIRQNPSMVDDLAVSLRTSSDENRSVAGEYNPIERVVTLMKHDTHTDTAVHEILHHLERMMPPAMQAAIRNEWSKRLGKGYKDAVKSGDVHLIQYYTSLINYHFGGERPNVALIQQAEEMIATGAVGIQHYENFNPSEFWAVNGSRILAGRYGVHGSILGRMRQWLREFVQKIKGLLRLRSDHSILRALDSIAAADGAFTSGVMLQDRAGVHFMYAGPKTLDQEARNSLQTYRIMRKSRKSAEIIRLATGWFVSPLDGKLRYEFSDHDAEFTQTRPPHRMEAASYSEIAKRYPLEEVLDHPTLFEHYPEARNITVTLQHDGNDADLTTQGWYNEHTNTVNITPYAKNHLSTLLHEIQHWVQQQEGFASGSTPQDIAHMLTPEQRGKLFESVMKEIEPGHKNEQAALDFMLKLQNWDKHDDLVYATDDLTKAEEAVVAAHASGDRKVVAKAREKRMAAEEKVLKLRGQAAVELTGDKTLPPDTLGELDYWSRHNKLDADRRLAKLLDRVSDRDHLINELSAGIDSAESLAVLGAGTDALFKAYRAAAGEIEARDTQFRMTLTPKERAAAKPLFISKDIDPDMISTGKGKAQRKGGPASKEAPENARLAARAKFDAAIAQRRAEQMAAQRAIEAEQVALRQRIERERATSLKAIEERHAAEVKAADEARQAEWKERDARRERNLRENAALAAKEEKTSRRNLLGFLAASAAGLGGWRYMDTKRDAAPAAGGKPSASKPAATDNTTLGRAKPVDAKLLDSRISAGAEKLLRNGQRSGTTDINGIPALRRMLQQIAQDQPELAGLARLVHDRLPESGLMVTVDDHSTPNLHGSVSIIPMPHLKLYTAEGRTGLTYGTILHELLHATVASRYRTLSLGVIRSNDEKLGSTTPQAAKQLAQFRAVWEEFREAGVDAAALDTETQLSVQEALQDPDEFFVRALTDASFQKVLSGIKYKGKTLLEKFRDWVKTIMGVATGEQASWLDAALEASNELASAYVLDPADWKRLRTANAMRDGPAENKSVMNSRMATVKSVTDAVMERVPAGRPRESVQTLGHMIRNSAGSMIRGLTFTRDLLNMAADGLPSAVLYGQLEEQRNALKIRHLHEADQIVSAHKAMTVPERAAANTFIKRSTMGAKWGFKPLHLNPVDQANIKIDPAMRDAFNALSKPAQANVRAVFAHGYTTLKEMKRLVNSNVAKEFDAAIAAAASDPKEVAKLQKDKADQLKHFSTLLQIGEFHPYAPLKRFGNHVVVGKSKAYLDAEAAAKAAPDNDKLQTALRDMQSQPAHYYVAMRETRHEAQMLAAKIKDQYASADAMEKDSGYLSEVGGNRGMLGMFHRLRGQANRESDTLDAKARAASQRMLTDLYLSLLSEASARQSERERKNVAGAEEDMMRAFHSKSRADANFLASLATAGNTQDALEAMEKEANKNGEVNGTTREQRTDHFREILKRHVQDMDYKQSPMVDKALETSSIFQLLTNPAYHLTNLLQPYVMSAPTMAGRFGMVRSMGALMTAHKQLGVSMFKNGVDHSSIDDMPTDVKDGVLALMNKGLINMSLDSEHGADWGDGKLGKPLRVLKRTSERIEAINRTATGVAALRLAKGHGMSDSAAIDYAAKIIYDTHGDYSGFNAPSMMRSPIARLVTQYRKFQLIQISNYVRLFRDAFANAKLTPEERWVARRALAYNLSTMFALGGTLALPGAQFIGAMLGGIFGDDDEPDNPELTMRRYLSEAGLEGVSDLLVKGVPAWLGVDVSGRLGAGNILSPFPYSDTSQGVVSRTAAESFAVAVTGPFIGGLIPKLFGGARDVWTGDVYKGIENLMPNGIGNILKGARIATQGVTMKNGDTVMQPEEISVLAGIAQGIGLPTTTVTERKLRGEALREMDLHYKTQVTGTKREYVQAYRDGDAAAMAEAREEWANLQQRMKAHGFTPPKVSDLVKAPHEAKKREGMLVQGVPTTKRTAGAARQLAEIYD